MRRDECSLNCAFRFGWPFLLSLWHAYKEVVAMPKRPRAPTSALACCRCFEPARLQQQLRFQAYQHLVPGSRPRNARGPGMAGSSPPDREPVSVSPSNPFGGICA